MARPRLRSLAFYDKHYQMVACYANRSSPEPFHFVKKEYFYVAPDQVRLLSYAEAVDFENRLMYAQKQAEQIKDQLKEQLKQQLKGAK